MDKDFFLIKKMQQGDERAIELFVKKYYSHILKYCRHHCYDMEYAEDLTQETFVHFFQRFGEYRHYGKAKNYLYTIAGNLCKDYYKKISVMPMEQPPVSEGNHDDKIQNRLLIHWG